MDMIKTTNLTKKYGELKAVDGINLSIKQGEIFGLLGPNGAGKTTTLMMLSSLLKPTSGTAEVNGYDTVSRAGKVRESIGMVFQDPSSDPVLTAYDNLKLHALLYNLPLKTIKPKIEQVLSLVELEKRKHDIVKTFSGGMRRRMEIARGLLHEPKIFFLDEPTLGLDPQTRVYIWKYIKSLAERINMTVVLTTHYMEEAEKLCGRIAIIDHGRIVALDSPANLIKAIGGDIVMLRGRLNIEELGKLPFVKEIKHNDGAYRLAVENAGKNLQQLLCAAGEIDNVEVHSPDLNDVFIYYTGKQMREQEGDEDDFMRDLGRVRSAR
jgi:ABC-2 type transport system ATP-binding protein